MRKSAFSVLVLLALLGCEKQEVKQEAPKKDAEAEAKSKVEAIDPNLAEAVAAASVDAPMGKPGSGKAVEGGPPPDGVFAPGAADKELPRGGFPKLTLGSEGADPKQQLGPGKTLAKLSGTIQVSMQTDPRQPALPVLISVAVEPKKVEAPKDDKAAPAPQGVTVRVTGAKVDAPGIPKDVDEQIGKLKGSKVEFSLLPNGAAVGFRYSATKGAPEEFARSLSDALASVVLPYPDKPLGVGGFYMVTTRDDFLGLDLVTYRMIKVKEVTPEGVTLDVNTKRYSASRTLELPGMPPEIDKTLVQFESVSEGTVQLPLGAIMPTKGEMSSVLGAQFNAPDPKRRPGIQFQTRAQLDLK